MPEPDIIVCDDRDALNREAATRFVDLAASAIAERGRFMAALSGGSTPKALFELLATEEWRSRVEWEHVHLFWGDERFVPRDHQDSNFRMANEALISHVDIPKSNVHRVPTESGEPITCSGVSSAAAGPVYGGRNGRTRPE